MEENTTKSNNEIIESTNSVASVKSSKIFSKNNVSNKKFVLYFGVAQIFLGFFMFVFGVFVIIHKGALSQVGSGIWGGAIAMATGVAGVVAAAEALCPFNAAAQKMAHTIFLAMSLVSIALSQLVVVISSIGLARDVNKNEEPDEHSVLLFSVVSEKHLSAIYSIGLIVASTIECFIAIVASYKSSKELCPCFKKDDEPIYYQENLNFSRSHAIVSNWLGKSSPVPTPMYVIAGPPSSLGGSKISSNINAPVFAVMQPSSIIGYPLIPAPLGSVPSPIIPPTKREFSAKNFNKKYVEKYKARMRQRSREPTPRRSVSKERDVEITQEEVAKTYTGLDRAIAEEFIDICDSKNNSLCSTSSTYSTSSASRNSCICANKGQCTCSGENVQSDTASHECLIK